MASPPVLLVVFLILLHQNLFSSADTSSIVEQTCKQVVSKGIDFNFCVETLRKNPKSSTAGTRGLAVIATQQSKLEFVQVLIAVKQLQHGHLAAPDKEALSVCAEVYEDGIDALLGAIKFIRAGSESDALTYLSAALTYVTTCDDAFDEIGHKSPVAEISQDALDYSRLALAITSLL
ncbi:hypothetical protein HPP92_003892 [Vanilla planifolia]|uniref:Pectinesterase inhibitor domain-containing protein n=1 Tax=Vanilla planifolia TaxID=51239 RepID=A0A835SB97_VANPL|nr:hypothetical protein HPP92_003892 [Vanilla planifolia]